MVKVLCEAPARLFGSTRVRACCSREVTPTSSFFDPEARTTLGAARLHSRSDYTIFEGMEIEGAIREVLVRGRSVVSDGELVSDPVTGTSSPQPAAGALALARSSR